MLILLPKISSIVGINGMFSICEKAANMDFVSLIIYIDGSNLALCISRSAHMNFSATYFILIITYCTIIHDHNVIYG